MLIGLAGDSSPRPRTRVVPAGRRLAAMASILRDWFVMLATTRMTKSFKMVLLRAVSYTHLTLPTKRIV